MRYFLLIILSLALFSCDPKTDNTPDTKNPPPASDKTFWALDNTKDSFQRSSYYQVNAKLLYSETHVNVYIDVLSYDKVDSVEAKFFADEFNNKIYPKVTGIFGVESDRNADGKVNILFLDIKDGSAGPSSGYIGGYFYGVDLYSANEISQAGFDIPTNFAEMLYIDCVENNIDTNNLTVKSTIAHEFQHMIGFNQRFFIRNVQNALDTWINEALAESAEFEVYGSNALMGRFNYIASNSFNLGTSLEYWPSNGSGTLSDYALSSTYINFASNQFSTDQERYNFLAGVQNGTNFDYAAISNNLSYLTGTSIERFKKSFFQYVTVGLVRVVTDAFPGISKSNFSGIRFSSAQNQSDRGFVPRVFKYASSASLSITGDQFNLFDVSSATYTEAKSIGALGELDNLGYSAAFVFSSNLTDNFFNFALSSAPQVAKRAKEIILTNSSFRMDNVIQFGPLR
ncbi:MAG: hypothetical protein KDD94_02880 [Calditrichaeota bacterium]|nr:hypothetical protein [Calditrichota bacterium]